MLVLNGAPIIEAERVGALAAFDIPKETIVVGSDLRRRCFEERYLDGAAELAQAFSRFDKKVDDIYTADSN